MSIYIAVEFDKDFKKQLEYERVLVKNKYPDAEYEDSSKYHITVRYVSDESVLVNQTLEAFKIYEQKYSIKAFDIQVNGFCKFPQGVLWYAPQNTLPLYEIKHNLEECLRQTQDLREDDFDGYTPHITCAYNFQHDIDFTTSKTYTTKVNNISLWNSFKANGEYIDNCLYQIKLR